MGRNTHKVVLIMKRYLTAAVLAFAACAQCAYADLVWSKDRGWQVEGGVLSNIFGNTVNVENALQAMNEGKAAQEDGDLWTAISCYQLVVNEYPESIFAPEAYFQLGLVYTQRGQFEDAYNSFGEIIKRYPDYQKFNQVIGEQFKVAAMIQDGATPYLWGWFPWFTNYDDAIKFYEGIVKNAPYSDYAPIALMNISLVAADNGKPEVAEDALDRLINTYPNSLFTPDAYLQMARIFKDMVMGPEYDQDSTKKAISFYQDYLILFPQEAGVINAEKSLDEMRDTYARSRLVMGNFYYYYRTDNRAASIFYNETITLAPNSSAAEEARKQLAKIKNGDIAPMTPVDWIWGRYERPSIDSFEDETKILALNSEEYEAISVEDFLSVPGTAVEEIITPEGTETKEGFTPLVGPSPFFTDEGFWNIEDTQ